MKNKQTIQARPENIHAPHATGARRTVHSAGTLRRTMLAGLIMTALVGGGMAPTVVRAQSVNATLRGDGPPNAQVTAYNVNTGLTRQTKVNAQGHYALVGLPPGTYQVDAGPGTQQTVTLTVASSSTLNFKAAASSTPSAANAKSLGTVQVTAQSLPEVKTSQVGTTISQQQIRTLPQATRNFLEFADTVPGMQFTVTGANHNTSLQAGAQSPNGVNVYIDGVSQKSYVMGGGVAGQVASQGNPFPELAIGEYKVITSNYKAEYAQVTSAAVTSLTKSGTNEFHGEVFARYTNETYRARTPTEIANEQEGGLAGEGIRLRHRRSDHQGQDALLLHLRRQALQHAERGGGQRQHDLRGASTCRPDVQSAVRPGQPAVRGEPVLRQAGLGTDRPRSLRAHRARAPGARQDPASAAPMRPRRASTSSTPTSATP